jgi:hypothetical protein
LLAAGLCTELQPEVTPNAEIFGLVRGFAADCCGFEA